MLEVPVVRVEVERKINTAAGSPKASRVNVPVIPREGLLYAPGVFVVPPNSTPVTVPPRFSDNAPDAAVNAVMDAPPKTLTPDVLITPVGAVALPTPMSEPAVPVIPDDVALVTAVFARTPYEDAEPMLKGVSTACAALEKKVTADVTTSTLTENFASNGENFFDFFILNSFLSMDHGALCSAY